VGSPPGRCLRGSRAERPPRSVPTGSAAVRGAALPPASETQGSRRLRGSFRPLLAGAEGWGSAGCRGRWPGGRGLGARGSAARGLLAAPVPGRRLRACCSPFPAGRGARMDAEGSRGTACHRACWLSSHPVRVTSVGGNRGLAREHL